MATLLWRPFKLIREKATRTVKGLVDAGAVRVVKVCTGSYFTQIISSPYYFHLEIFFLARSRGSFHTNQALQQCMRVWTNANGKGPLLLSLFKQCIRGVILRVCIVCLRTLMALQLVLHYHYTHLHISAWNGLISTPYGAKRFIVTTYIILSMRQAFSRITSQHKYS